MLRIITAMLTVIALTCFAACGGSDHHGHNHTLDDDNAFGEVAKAICVLTPTNNEELPGVTGTITFTQTKSGLLIQASITGLKPNAKHALGICQWGDLSASDGSATGQRYDPDGVGKHGQPNIHAHGDEVHAIVVGKPGGLGNIETDADGKATYSLSYENLSLTGHHALLGRAVVIHLNQDNGEEPDGNAGPRVAQGVIGIANPE